jgi:hypothetical protein
MYIESQEIVLIQSNDKHLFLKSIYLFIYSAPLEFLISTTLQPVSI